MTFWQKHKWKIIVPVLIVLVLAAAFVFGDRNMPKQKDPAEQTTVAAPAEAPEQPTADAPVQTPEQLEKRGEKAACSIDGKHPQGGDAPQRIIPPAQSLQGCEDDFQAPAKDSAFYEVLNEYSEFPHTDSVSVFLFFIPENVVKEAELHRWTITERWNIYRIVKGTVLFRD